MEASFPSHLIRWQIGRERLPTDQPLNEAGAMRRPHLNRLSPSSFFQFPSLFSSYGSCKRMRANGPHPFLLVISLPHDDNKRCFNPLTLQQAVHLEVFFPLANQRYSNQNPFANGDNP